MGEKKRRQREEVIGDLREEKTGDKKRRGKRI